jgi:predicted metal-dependent hydrolase
MTSIFRERYAEIVKTLVSFLALHLNKKDEKLRRLAYLMHKNSSRWAVCTVASTLRLVLWFDVCMVIEGFF